MKGLVLSRLEKTYGDGTAAVCGIDLMVGKGSFVVLLGPSGCGKTTTLRMVAGLEQATGGRIELEGQEITKLRPSERNVGMVFQFYALYPHMTVRENIEFPLRAAGMSRRERIAKVEGVACRMGLRSLLPRHPGVLSGGDKQRVALARAMVREPALYLMDEPLSTLDGNLRLEMREFIRSQQLETRVTTLYVTHDQEEAMSLADLVVVMDKGRIAQAGPPKEIYDRPASLFVARFVGSPGMNLIEGHLGEASGEVLFRAAEASIPFPGRPIGSSGPLVLGIRPEHLRADPRGPISGEVAMTEFLGSSRTIHVRTASGRLIFRDKSGARHAPGDRIRLALEDGAARLFDAATGKAL